MRKVMPGCFLGWNGVGCLVGAAGLGGEAGYRGEAPREVGGKKGPRGVPGMLAKRFWGFLDVADWRGKMIAPGGGLFGMGGIVRGWVLTVGMGSCTVISSQKIRSTRYEKGHARVLFGVE